MSQRKTTFLNIVKAAFFILFVGFSYESVQDYIQGKIVYDIINEYNPKLVFPSITLCPKKKDELIHIDLERLAQKYPHLQSMLTFYFVFGIIGNMSDPFGLVRDYSFNFNETVRRTQLMASSSGNGTFVSPEEYDEAVANFKKALATSENYFASPPIPIAYREVLDYKGRCFNFKTEEFATLEPQYQGIYFIK